MKIVLDTSVLMDLFERKRDVFEDCEDALEEPCSFYATQSTVAELKSIAAGHGAVARAAKACVALEGSKFSVIHSSGKADDAFLQLPKSYGVATNDKQLAARLKEAGLTVLTQKQVGMRIA